MSAAFPEGTIFADRYRIVRRIAMGGMGAVYPHMFESEALRDRFKQEARIAAQIESEHIVETFGAQKLSTREP